VDMYGYVICVFHTNKCIVLSMLLYVFCLQEATHYWTFRIVAARGKRLFTSIEGISCSACFNTCAN